MKTQRRKKNRQKRNVGRREVSPGAPQSRRYAILSDRRVAAATTLAEDIPGHKAGVPVVWVYRVPMADGTISTFPVPLPSELLLHAGTQQLNRATKLRTKLLSTAMDIRSGERSMQNHQLVFEFFESATVGAAMVFAGLSNFVNEHIPRDFVFDHKGKRYDRDAIIASFGIEMRLSRILAQATGTPNLRTEKPDYWEALMRLKGLRDDIEHADGGSNGYQPGEDENVIFGRLLNEQDLSIHANCVREVIDAYRQSDHLEAESSG